MLPADLVSETVHLTCPFCGAVSEAEMPLDACLLFYDCPACRVVLRPRPGDCCVFCSYGERRCPSARQQ